MSASLFVSPRYQPLDISGTPLYAAFLTFFVSGSNTTLAPIYADSALSTPLANPLQADAAGTFPAVWLDSSITYRVLLTQSDGQQRWVEDAYIPSGSGGTGGGGTTPGSAGLSVAEIYVYLRSDTAPPTPTGGSYNFATQSLTPPAGWSQPIPTGNAPAWQSATVAAVEGTTGTDSLLTWSPPVKVMSDGQGTQVIFRRNAGLPATPAPSVAIPSGWYDSNTNVPASADTLWASNGVRAYEGANWVFSLPYQIEGDAGPPGADGSEAILYYISPQSGTALKNGSGTLKIVAHRVSGGTDQAITSGGIGLYSGSTLCTQSNGFAAGSDGFTAFLDAGDIAGSIVITLKDGPAGAALDTITLVDIADGTSGGPGTDGVYSYVECDGPLAWVRENDQATWIPSATTLLMSATFVQTGADVARVGWLVTRDADGLLTGASATHASGDLNGSRVTVTELGSGSQVYAPVFTYSYLGDVSVATETCLTSLSGSDGSGSPGPTGPGALVLAVTKPAIGVMAYANGGVVSLASANGQATLYEGTTDQTTGCVINPLSATGCTGRINTAVNTPIAGQPKGYYQVDTLSSDTATMVLSASYGGNSATTTISIFKSYVGYEIVTGSSLPNTNLFPGRIVFLTSDSKLYRYNGTAWTREVDGADIKANSITTNSIGAGQITAAKIQTTSLSALSANLGTVTAGVLQSGASQATSGATFDLSNARIMFDTAPGQAGTGYVRIEGYGFGPTNQYLDWYGRKPAAQSTHAGIIANLTDAGGLYWLKTDGSAIDSSRLRGEFEPKCWVRFDGKTGGVVTIRDRFNVASVTRISVGVYRIVFASALPNANYVAFSNADLDGDGQDAQLSAANTLTTSQFNVDVRGTGGGHNDAAVVSVIVYGSNVVAGSNASTPSGGYGGGTLGKGNIP